jgi:hypothetical protein
MATACWAVVSFLPWGLTAPAPRADSLPPPAVREEAKALRGTWWWASPGYPFAPFVSLRFEENTRGKDDTWGGYYLSLRGKKHPKAVETAYYGKVTLLRKDKRWALALRDEERRTTAGLPSLIYLERTKGALELIIPEGKLKGTDRLTKIPEKAGAVAEPSPAAREEAMKLFGYWERPGAGKRRFTFYLDFRMQDRNVDGSWTGFYLKLMAEVQAGKRQELVYAGLVELVQQGGRWALVPVGPTKSKTKGAPARALIRREGDEMVVTLEEGKHKGKQRLKKAGY